MAKETFTICDMCPNDGKLHLASERVTIHLSVRGGKATLDVCDDHLKPVSDLMNMTPVSYNGPKLSKPMGPRSTDAATGIRYYPGSLSSKVRDLMRDHPNDVFDGQIVADKLGVTPKDARTALQVVLAQKTIERVERGRYRWITTSDAQPEPSQQPQTPAPGHGFGQ